MKNIPLFLIAILMTTTTVAQQDTKRQADEAYDKKGYLKAIHLYQQLGESGLDDIEKIRLADSYRLNGDTESAEYWYAQAVKTTAYPEDILHYAQMLQSNGHSEKALDWYDQYRILMGDNFPMPRAGVEDCTKLVFTSKKQVQVSHLKALSSAHLDYAATPYRGGVVFTSTRGKHQKELEDQWTKDNFSDIFFARSIDNQRFEAVEALEGAVNGKYHDGVVTFDNTGTKMYFSSNSHQGKNSQGVVDLKIYSAELHHKKWGNIQALPINIDAFATCHPTLSVDGNTLYFTSNRAGGFGGMDLYKSTRSGNYWSVPQNLGPTVNTAGNELFPFISKTGVLYFASDGLLGIGGLDIYETHLVAGAWAQPENLGAPINSIKDDFGYSQLPNGESGYLTSNRAGGLGGDDLYSWSENAVMTTAPQNNITVVDDITGSRITDALVTIAEGVYKNRGNIPTAKQVKNGELPDMDYRSQPLRFLTDGKGTIQPDISQGKTYTIVVEKMGYVPVKRVVNAYELIRQSEWVVSMKKRQGVQLEGVVVQQKYNSMIPNASIELFNFCTGEYERTVSDEAGNFTFFLDCQCDYEVKASKERFSKDKKKYSTLGIDCSTDKPLKTILYLKVSDTKDD
ncbi:MAG: hypothetical protein AAGJ18_25785 [Bacteroidota bacterium]